MLIYGGITLVNLFQLILNLVITGIFIGSIGIFYSAIMRKTTVAVILSYVTVVLLVLGTVQASGLAGWFIFCISIRQSHFMD